MQGIAKSSKWWAKHMVVPFGLGVPGTSTSDPCPPGAPKGALYFRTDQLKLYIQLGTVQPGITDANGWFNLKYAQYAP